MVSILVAVGVLLERTIHLDADVVGLLLGELGEVCTQRWQVEGCNLLIQLLGQQVHILVGG